MPALGLLVSTYKQDRSHSISTFALNPGPINMPTCLNNQKKGVLVMAQWLTNPIRNHEVAGSIPGLAPWVRDLVLLWLWCRPPAAAPI